MPVVVDPFGPDLTGKRCERAASGAARFAAGIVCIKPLLQRTQCGAGADVGLTQNLLNRHQVVVAQPLKFADRAALSLRLGAFHHAIDQGVRELGRLQFGPWPFQAGAELLEHVAHAALAPGKMVDQIHAHGRPAQSGAINDGLVQFPGGGNAIVDHVQNLAPHRFLQSIGQMARNLPTHVQRVHADIGKELARGLDGGRGRLLASDQLNQW